MGLDKKKRQAFSLQSKPSGFYKERQTQKTLARKWKNAWVRQTCEIINSSHWRMNVCSITSSFQKILSAQFEVCPLQMCRQNYCATKAENRTRFARMLGLCILQIRFDVHLSLHEKLYLRCSHYRVRVLFIPELWTNLIWRLCEGLHFHFSIQARLLTVIKK